ncbi:MAG: SDR family NAD(P)-dependent oxidoreductase [Magnetovibrionaceae bacterium]
MMPPKLPKGFDLSGRVVLVTGGAGHLGRSTVGFFEDLGATVCVADRTSAEGLGSFGFTVDLEDEAATRALPTQVVEACARLDIIVANAAFVGTSDLDGWAVPFEQQSLETWRRAVEVNLTSVFNLVQAATPHLKASGQGAVVLVSSIYGAHGPDWGLYEGTTLGNPAAYGASKGGLEQLCRWLATTLAPDIRVNAVRPGGIERGQDPAFQGRYCEKVPMGRMAVEADVAAAIGFLASDLAGYITGQVLAVDGGWSAW